MKFYLAPLEGVTNYLFRQKFDKYFHSVDKYYIPFLTPKDNSLKKKEYNDIDIRNNKLSAKVVPQILSHDAKNTLWLISELEKRGYDEVNLNFGCPSRTVTAKRKGAGILNDLNLLDDYLNELFSNTSIKISIKMRLGFNDTSSFYKILEILNKYNIYELIIHPRTANDQYTGKLHLDYLDNLNEKTDFDIIYNGECNSLKDIEYIKNRFPYIKGIMFGRGLIQRPYLLNNYNDNEIIESIRNFYKELANESVELYTWGNAQFYLKQILAYLFKSFDIPLNLYKKIFKSNSFEEFNDSVLLLFTYPLKKDEDQIIKFL